MAVLLPLPPKVVCMQPMSSRRAFRYKLQGQTQIGPAGDEEPDAAAAAAVAERAPPASSRCLGYDGVVQEILAFAGVVDAESASGISRFFSLQAVHAFGRGIMEWSRRTSYDVFFCRSFDTSIDPKNPPLKKWWAERTDLRKLIEAPFFLAKHCQVTIRIRGYCPQLLGSIAQYLQQLYSRHGVKFAPICEALWAPGPGLVFECVTHTETQRGGP
eukprot:TRINITY_DN49040_c0_g1_i1.p1 TRINITY_DN49040_c0_g1~~TRINITY_DN49040_c0_g1_i1.p1  ORF type:complete len:215 (-),score=25.62 TRINITY_DN49040_c0_g1_i1:274-918(-)